MQGCTGGAEQRRLRLRLFAVVSLEQTGIRNKGKKECARTVNKLRIFLSTRNLNVAGQVCVDSCDAPELNAIQRSGFSNLVPLFCTKPW